MLLITQLEKKQQRHQSFLKFLREKLSSQISFENIPDLEVNQEKLAATISLKKKQDSFGEKNILISTLQRKYASSGPNFQEAFYTKVSEVYKIIYDFKLESTIPAYDPLFVCNEIFQSLFGIGGISPKCMAFLVPSDAELLPAFTKHLETFADILNRIDFSSEKFRALLDQLYTLSDFLLQVYSHLKGEFQGQKERVVLPFVSLDTSKALRLAEIYRVFAILANPEVCNDEQLQFYMHKFKAEQFPEFVFRVYLKKGEYWKLLSQPDAFDPELTNFLKAHPKLSWIHDIKIHSFQRAASVLFDQAEQEELLYTRKKTLLSLSKLNLLAEAKEPRNPDKKVIDQWIYCLQAQEDLFKREKKQPEDIHGILSPDNLIEKVLRRSVIAALDLYENTANILQKPDELLIAIWKRALDISRDKFKKAAMQTTETATLQLIKDSEFYQAATNPISEGLLQTPFLQKLVENERQNQDASYQRVLGTLLTMISNRMRE